LTALGFKAAGGIWNDRNEGDWKSPQRIIRDLKIAKDAQIRVLSEIRELDSSSSDFGVQVSALLDFHFKTHEYRGSDYMLSSYGWVKTPICPGCGRKPKWFYEFGKRGPFAEFGFGCTMTVCGQARINDMDGLSELKTVPHDSGKALDVQSLVLMSHSLVREEAFVEKLWSGRTSDGSEPVGPFYAWLDVFHTFQELKDAADKHGFKVPHCLNGWDGMTKEEQMDAIWDVHDYPEGYGKLRGWPDSVYEAVRQKRKESE